MTVYNITFSPTGGTKRVADILACELGKNIVNIELCVPENELKTLHLTEEDICIISVPSFGGRVPEIAVNRIAKIKGNGAKAVLVCVYGNRAYEDTLYELKDVTEKTQFKCIAGVAALAEHSIVRTIAKERPDKTDEKMLKNFAEKIRQKIDNKNFEFNVDVPGSSTYKEHIKSKSVPETRENCIGCRTCSKACPTGAIDFDNPKLTDNEMCASCMKCISVCPINARGLKEEVLNAITERLSKICADRKENELFV